MLRLTLIVGWLAAVAAFSPSMSLSHKSTLGMPRAPEPSWKNVPIVCKPSLPLKRDDTGGSHTLIYEAKFEHNRIVIRPRRIRRRRNRVEQINYVIGGMLRDAKKLNEWCWNLKASLGK